MVTRSVIAIVLLQGCLMNAASVPSSSNLRAFHLWMENNYDPSIHPGQLKSPECQGKDDGIYGNPTDCSPAYTVCSDGNTIASEVCRSGLVFDEAMGNCVAPEASTNCKYLVTTVAPPVTIPPFTCTDGRPNGLYPISGCSANYYVCTNGEMRLAKCQVSGEVFDPVTLVCKNNATVAGCTATTTASTASTATTTLATTTTTLATTTTTQAPTTVYNPCFKGDGTYSYGPCLNQYYVCISNIPYNETCPPGSVLNSANLICQNPANVTECTNPPTSPSTTTSTTPSTPTSTVTIETTSSSSVTESTSTSPVTVSTTTGSTPSVSTTTKPSGNNTWACPGNEGNYPIPGTCGSDYYVCISGSPYVYTCPNGAIFDPVQHVCVSASNATCKNPFKCPEPNGNFPIPSACCSLYYTCVANVATEKKCPGPPTTVFDPILLICTSADKADRKSVV